MPALDSQCVRYWKMPSLCVCFCVQKASFLQLFLPFNPDFGVCIDVCMYFVHTLPSTDFVEVSANSICSLRTISHTFKNYYIKFYRFESTYCDDISLVSEALFVFYTKLTEQKRWVTKNAHDLIGPSESPKKTSYNKKRHTIKRFGHPVLSLSMPVLLCAVDVCECVCVRTKQKVIVCTLQLWKFEKGAKMFQQSFGYCSCLSRSATNGTSLKSVLRGRGKKLSKPNIIFEK